MNKYRLTHPTSEHYCLISSTPGLKRYQNTAGWIDYWLGDHLVFSHRVSHYTTASFPEKLHSHDYYELLIPRTGNVGFVADDNYISPPPGALILFHPNSIHTGRLLAESDYERYVFRFDAEAFSLFGETVSPLSFLHNDALCIEFPADLVNTLYQELHTITTTLCDDNSDTALLAYSHIARLLCLINRHATVSHRPVQAIPQHILKIKQYVDEHYLTLHTTTEIAEHFYYRREHVSRLFKEYFNTNLSDYLTSRKVLHSQKLLKEGESVTDACYKSGFRNMSTFLSAFRLYTNMNPSAFRNVQKNIGVD